MRKFHAVIAALCLVAASEVLGQSQSQNVDMYVTNITTTVSATTPTKICDVDQGRTSLSILFATNSPAGIGVRFLEMNGPYQTNWYGTYKQLNTNGTYTTVTTTNTWTWQTQTNQFKAGTLYGTYINPAGTFGSVQVPIGFEYDAHHLTKSSIFAISDGGGSAIINVRSGTMTKP